MPICRTCRGDYGCQEALCPHCEQPVGRDVALCRHCGTDTSSTRLCPRCGCDVSWWEHENDVLLEFVFFKGGLLGLLPAVAALVAWVFVFNLRDPGSFYYFILSLVSASLSFLVFVVLYIKRLFWRERWWAAQVYRVQQLSLVLLISVTSVLGIFAGAFASFLYMSKVEPFDMVGKLFFAGLYVPMYIFLTAALTLLFNQRYLEKLDQSVPRPIYVDTNRLLHVVVSAVDHSVNLIHDEPGDCQNNGKRHVPCSPHDEMVSAFEVLEIVRIPENGGLLALLRESRCQQTSNGLTLPEANECWQLYWRVQADRWGRLQSVHSGTPEPYQEGQRIFEDYGRFS